MLAAFGFTAPHAAPMHPTPYTRQSFWGLLTGFTDREWETRYRREQTANASRMLRVSNQVFLCISLAVIASAVGALGLGITEPVVQLCLLTGLVLGIFALAARHRRNTPRDWLNIAFAGVLMVLVFVLPPLILGSSSQPALRISLLEFGYCGPLLFAFAAFVLIRLSLLQALAVNLSGLTAYGLVLQSIDWFPTIDLIFHLHAIGLGILLGGLGGWMFDRLMREAFVQRELLAQSERTIALERERSERLLLNILPAPIAQRLKSGETPLADGPTDATVIFADIVGFTPLAEKLPPRALVAMLDELFSRFDAIVAEHGLEKIKTIGDAYMAVAGVPATRPDHPTQAARVALALRDATRQFSGPGGQALRLRIGVDTGPIIAGVIGRSKFAYDLWGDVVNTASRMESTGEPDRIHVTASFAGILAEGFACIPRRRLEIKGKGVMQTYWLEREPESQRPPSG